MTAELTTIHDTSNERNRQRLGSDVLSIFTLRAYCPFTKKQWTIVKKYSQFLALRLQIIERNENALQCAYLKPIVLLLESLIGLPFPKKPLSIDSDDEIEKRDLTFQRMTTLLMRVRHKCIKKVYSDSRVRHDILCIQSLVEDFLNVPSIATKPVEYTTLARIIPTANVVNPFDQWINACVQFVAFKLNPDRMQIKHQQHRLQ